MARDWEVLQKTQPVEAARQMRESEWRIRTLAEALGVRLDRDQVSRLAEGAIRQGWDEAEVQFRVGRQYEYRPKGVGQGAQVAQELQELGNDYGIRVGDKALQQWTRRIVAGTGSVDDYRSRLIEQAKGRYPSIAGDLDRGVTVDQLFDSYRQLAAETLGISPTAIDVRDPKYQEVFSYRPKGEKESRAMTLDEWGQRLRTQRGYGYDATQDAESKAARLAAAIQQDFGVRA
jgi:hypothetical protein